MTARILAAVLLLLAGPSWAHAAPARYSAQIDQKRGVIHLEDRLTGKTLWSRKTSHREPSVTWSPDHKSVAIDVLMGPYASPWIWLWREGYPLQIVDLGGGPDGFDYNMESIWSPDGRRVIVRPGASGSSDMGPHGAGSIVVYTLRHHGKPLERYLAQEVWEAKWQGSDKVIFRVYDYQQLLCLHKPHIWRLSKRR